VADAQVLLTGLSFGESPRWHEGRLWLADWGAGEVLAVDAAGQREVMARVDFMAFPMCIDWLPDGRLLIVAARDGKLLRQEPDGSLVTHADLTGLADKGLPWNEIVVDGRGHVYLNNQGFDFPGAEFAPGTIALLTPDGGARQVAGGIAFPNGMAITPDNATLIVAESYGQQLTAFDIAADGSLARRRLLLRPGWPRPDHPVHRGHRMARHRPDGRSGPHWPGADRRGARPGRRLALTGPPYRRGSLPVRSAVARRPRGRGCWPHHPGSGRRPGCAASARSARRSSGTS
jgi:SMP-30/Gluconolactonase/LRE-like region